MGETSIKSWGNQLELFYALISSIWQQNKKYSVVLICSLFFQHHLLGDSIIHCKWYCVSSWFHFTGGVFQIIVFLYSFRGVGAMEIVAMDMKVRSIVLLIVKC